MTKIASLFVCLFLVGTFIASHYLSPLGSSALAFEPIHQSLVVKVKKDKKDDDDDDDDKPKKKSKPFTCKKAKCDPGETKLDKPNIYGACCQVGAAPLTPKTTPDAAVPEKCKFPGEVGTPPNCKCPEGDAHSGYEFLGYKGCVRFTYATACGTGPITPQSETAWTKREESECKAKTGVVSFTCSYPGPGEKKCCCKRKVF